jgi:hypothetical protein
VYNLKEFRVDSDGWDVWWLFRLWWQADNGGQCSMNIGGTVGARVRINGECWQVGRKSKSLFLLDDRFRFVACPDIPSQSLQDTQYPPNGWFV